MLSMKRVSLGQRIRRIRISRKRSVRALRSKQKAYIRRYVRSVTSGQQPTSRPQWKRAARRILSRTRFILVAPRVFGLTVQAARTELLRFLCDLRRITILCHSTVCIDFSKTKQMYPDGTLLFAAELDRILRAAHNKSVITCTYPSDDVVEQVLQHLGLLQAMRRSPRLSVTADNVRYWKLLTDTVASGEKAATLAEEYQKHFSGRNRMYDGLVEAMTNCVQHAYIKPRPDGTGLRPDKRWWMFSEERDGKLTVVFCDLGIGINISLSSGGRWGLDKVRELMQTLARKNSVSRYIKVATMLGKSSTAESYRGKGLQDLKSVVESVDNGWIEILSNEGRYRFSGCNTPEQLHDFSDSILGTLILWQIPIPKGGTDVN